ncbi:MAG: CinA family protein [Candidatus Thorarchaeota archaeon]
MEISKKLEALIKSLTKKNLRIAVAESCTGGYISHMITNIPGASKVFERGIVCYSNQAKIDLLKVDPQIIEKYGAVSENVVKTLAYNIRLFSQVDIGIGVSGIAGPSGGTPEKPVGLVYIGFSIKEWTFHKKYQFKTDRINFKAKVLEKVVKILEKYI